MDALEVLFQPAYEVIIFHEEQEHLVTAVLPWPILLNFNFCGLIKINGKYTTLLPAGEWYN